MLTEMKPAMSELEDDAFCPRSRICPLNRVKAGAAVRIKRLSTPPEVTQRLREIGLVEEQVIRLVAAQANLICQVCDARLALSAALSELILVEPVS